MPHLAEASWQALGHSGLLAESPWPAADPALLASETATIAIQVNGKRRDEIVLPVASSAEEIEAAVLRMDNVRRAVGDKTVRRVVVVPGRIANVVTD
jgi:leucyl-tRNA synthetase